MKAQIHPAVAIVLLLMITICIVVFAFVWFSRIGPVTNPDENTAETMTKTVLEKECISWKPVYDTECVEWEYYETERERITLCDFDEIFVSDDTIIRDLDRYLSETGKEIDYTTDPCSIKVSDLVEPYGKAVSLGGCPQCAVLSLVYNGSYCVEYDQNDEILYYTCTEWKEANAKEATTK